MIPFYSRPGHFEDADAVGEQARWGLLGSGKKVRQLEAELCRLTGYDYAVTCSSGTAALYLLAIATALNHRGPVLVPAYGVAAVWNALIWAGCDLHPVDIDPATGCISFKALQELGNLKRFGSVCWVDFSGGAGELDLVQGWCVDNGIFLFEDAACAIGRGDCFQADWATLSFGSVKDVACGQGGAVLFNGDRGTADIIRAFANQGIGYIENSVLAPGVNLRLDDLRAALVLSQLKRLDETLMHRSNIQRILTDGLGSKGYAFLDGTVTLHHPMLVSHPERLAQELHKREIDARRQYAAFWRHPGYQRHWGDLRVEDFPGARAWDELSLWLPFGLGLTLRDTTYMAATVDELLEKDQNRD